MLWAASATCDGGRAAARRFRRAPERRPMIQGVPSMIYELRVYRCIPNRLPALLKRFETTTLRLWQKHGIQQAGFWTTVIGESNQELTYLLAWESLAERERKWAAFVSDPEWVAVRNETEKDGPIVATIANSILEPTSFSSVR